MPTTLVDSGAAGGIMGVLTIAARELFVALRGTGGVTRKEMDEAIQANADNAKADAVQRAMELEKQTLQIAEDVKSKADEQDIKISILEHQRGCLAEIKADMRNFQAEILMSFTHAQEEYRDSIKRIHARIDDLVKTVDARINRVEDKIK